MYYRFDRFLTEEITANTITCIGGITDNSTSLQAIHNLLNKSVLGIFRVYFKQHNYPPFF